MPALPIGAAASPPPSAQPTAQPHLGAASPPPTAPPPAPPLAQPHLGAAVPTVQLLADAMREAGALAWGVARAEPVDDAAWEARQRWLRQGMGASMAYLDRYPQVRRDPRLLLDGARSIIVAAFSYYPPRRQPPAAPQFAWYAYGLDYHEVLRARLAAAAARLAAELGPGQAPGQDPSQALGQGPSQAPSQGSSQGSSQAPSQGSSQAPSQAALDPSQAALDPSQAAQLDYSNYSNYSDYSQAGLGQLRPNQPRPGQPRPNQPRPGQPRQAAAGFRVCVDTAPIMERYWAVKAGVGFIGRNAQLIVPGHGSACFLGEIITTLELPPSVPSTGACPDGCLRCLRACPGHALDNNSPGPGGLQKAAIAESPGPGPGGLQKAPNSAGSGPGGGGWAVVDARRCLSYLTIEHRGPLPAGAPRLGRRIYGCDACQAACPLNAGAAPTALPELQPNPALLALADGDVAAMTPERFAAMFRHSAVRRTRLDGLLRNLALLDPPPPQR